MIETIPAEVTSPADIRLNQKPARGKECHGPHAPLLSNTRRSAGFAASLTEWNGATCGTTSFVERQTRRSSGRLVPVLPGASASSIVLSRTLRASASVLITMRQLVLHG